MRCYAQLTVDKKVSAYLYHMTILQVNVQPIKAICFILTLIADQLMLFFFHNMTQMFPKMLFKIAF